MLLIGLSALPLYCKLLAPLLIAASWLWFRRGRASAVTGLRWDADRRELSFRVPGLGWQPATRIESITLLPWLLVVRLRYARGRRRLLIASDSVSPEAFRRLAVLARLAPVELSEPGRATGN
ncbi:MAG: hypothetical protein HWE39_04420 [Oceanospirillaceae bacterium]|nr:hypothetical protein [Oceanospirillaceae bacterium]